MALPQAAEAHYRSQQVLAAVTVRTTRRIWAQVDPTNIDGSWSTAGPRAEAVLTAAQGRAATDGALYVPEVLNEQGLTAGAVGEVDYRRLAGVSSSGAPLDIVLDTPIIRAKQKIAAGSSATSALSEAFSTLEGIVLTQVADAARVGASVAMVARPAIHGYVRMLNAPSCSRCAILAGKFFRWNTGFARHPRCDCRHIPTTENLSGDITTDPAAYFRSLDPAAQERIFTKAGAQAIRDGADIGQVVNARRGMFTAAGGFKQTRVDRRRVARIRARLMPEEIYKQAATRDDAIQALRAHGFLF